MKKKKILKAFKGAEADTRRGKAMSPGTSTTGGSRGEKGPGPSKIGPTVKDVPFKKPLGFAKSLALSSVLPFGGPLVNYVAKQNYKARQKFSRKQGLYRDAYRTTGKVLQPNSKIGKDYLKDAGFGKRPDPIINNNDSDPIKKILPILDTPMEEIQTTSYKKPTVTNGVFNYSVGLKKGGMLRQGKPKLAKKGWK